MNWLLVALGGGIGAAARFWLAGTITARMNRRAAGGASPGSDSRAAGGATPGSDSRAAGDTTPAAGAVAPAAGAVAPAAGGATPATGAVAPGSDPRVAGAQARAARPGVITPLSRLPWGTITVNVLGSLIIGAVAATVATLGANGSLDTWRLFLATGICGGFTTFSTATMETVTLARTSHYLAAVGNLLGTLAVTYLAVATGWIAAVAIIGPAVG